MHKLGFRQKKFWVLMLLAGCLLILAACGKDETQNSGLTTVTTPGAEQSAGDSVAAGTQNQPEAGWDEAAILAEGYYNTEYNEYFVGGKFMGFCGGECIHKHPCLCFRWIQYTVLRVRRQ